ncbi:MAG: FkbM family methyltransferase [Candidatus Rokuibacteriota bacterium]
MTALPARGEGETRTGLLEALHALIPVAHEFPDVAAGYVALVRGLRERLHPTGVADVRRVEMPGGLKFDVDVGDRLGADVYYGYNSEAFDWTLLTAVTEAGATAVDIGANFGLYTVVLGRRVGPSGRVLAFEPDPAVFPLLKANVELNGLGNVRCEPICLGSVDGDVLFHAMTEPAFSGISPTGRARERATFTVGIRRLDSVLAGSGDVPLVVKIDVEGHEFEVLRGAQEALRRGRDWVVMLEVNAKNLDDRRRQELEQVLGELMAEGGQAWTAEIASEGLRRLTDAKESSRLAGANIFLVPADSAAEIRLRTAAGELVRKAAEEAAASLDIASGQLRNLRSHAGVAPAAGLYGAFMRHALQERDASVRDGYRLETRARDLDERVQALTAALENSARERVSERDAQQRLAEIRARDVRLEELTGRVRVAERELADSREAYRILKSALEALEADSEQLLVQIRDAEDRLAAAATPSAAAWFHASQWVWLPKGLRRRLAAVRLSIPKGLPLASPHSPTLSIVIGSYNRRPFLRLAIDSVRDNDISVPYEIIVVDGGSDDGTLQWLAEQKDVITIVQHNRGEFRGHPIKRRSWGYFMNLAFKSAQGKYVLMLSDDCLLLRNAVSLGLQRFDELHAEGRRVGGVAFYFRNWPDETTYYVQRTLGGKLFVNHGMYLRQALEDVGWADENRYIFYKADGDLCLKMWRAGWEVVDCPGAFVEHHAHANTAVRETNTAVLDHDRQAYLERWKGIYYDPYRADQRGRVGLDFEDPERTADRFLLAEREAAAGRV